MESVDFSNAVNPNSQPILEQTLDFMQQNAARGAFRSMQGMHNGKYTTGDVLIIYGCHNSGTGSTYNITAGVVLYNGNLYEVPAAAFTAAVGQTAVATLSAPAYESFDPVKLKPSGTPVSVHQTIKIGIASGVSGSGIKDFSDFKRNYGQITSTASNGLAITTVLSAGGPFAYTADSYKYSYRIENGILKLNFKIVFTNTNGADVEEFRIPLPAAITKAILTSDYATRGTAYMTAPGSTTNYIGLQVMSDSDGSEGQRFVLIRDDSTTTIDLSAASVTTLRGSIEIVLGL